MVPLLKLLILVVSWFLVQSHYILHITIWEREREREREREADLSLEKHRWSWRRLGTKSKMRQWAWICGNLTIHISWSGETMRFEALIFFFLVSFFLNFMGSCVLTVSWVLIIIIIFFLSRHVLDMNVHLSARYTFCHMSNMRMALFSMCPYFSARHMWQYNRVFIKLDITN